MPANRLMRALGDANRKRARLYGPRLRQARDKAQLSREAFGQRIGVSRVSVFRFEKGERYPADDVLAKVQAEFGVKPIR